MPITKARLEEIIDYFADSSRECHCDRCSVCTSNGNGRRSNPVNLGNVLAKMKDAGSGALNMSCLVDFWLECGIDKSLQEIVSASGWENGEYYCSCHLLACTPHTEKCDRGDPQLKSPEANALFEFINQLFGDTRMDTTSRQSNSK